MTKTFTKSVVSLLVPPLCCSCGEPQPLGGALCRSCLAGLVALPEQRCGRCGAPGHMGTGACTECRGRALAFRTAWAPFAYEGVAPRLVASLKSRGMLAVASFMGGALAHHAPAAMLAGTLVPVPCHGRRWRNEGFNPALAVARALGALAGLPVAAVLVRPGAERPQTGLTRRERLQDAGGPVAVRRRARPPAGALVLVDDVYTTGATLDSCARALRAAGADAVTALTFARTIRI